MKETVARKAFRKACLIVLSSALLLALAHQASAQGLNYKNISNPVICILCLIYGVFVYVAASLAALVFVAAGVQWIASRDDPAKRKAALDIMVHAIVGLLLVGIGNEIVTNVIGPNLSPVKIEGCKFSGDPEGASRGCTYGGGTTSHLLLPLFDALKPP